jgi:hypothetical protein
MPPGIFALVPSTPAFLVLLHGFPELEDDAFFPAPWPDVEAF